MHKRAYTGSSLGFLCTFSVAGNAEVSDSQSHYLSVNIYINLVYHKALHLIILEDFRMISYSLIII